jgi:hypothetical protein
MFLDVHAEEGSIMFVRNVGPYLTTRCHVPVVRNIHIHVSESPMSHGEGMRNNTVR